MFVCVIVNMLVRPYVSMIELVLHTNVCVFVRSLAKHILRVFVRLFVLGFTPFLIFRASNFDTCSHSS